MTEAEKITSIFSHWNSHKGCGYGKVKWKSHRIFSLPCQQAVRKRLRQGYKMDDLKQAIDNYARVLTHSDCKWSYAWNLLEFLIRHRPDRRKEEQLWRWLPGQFELDDYIKPKAKVDKARAAEPKAEPFEEVTQAEKDAILAETPMGRRILAKRRKADRMRKEP